MKLSGAVVLTAAVIVRRAWAQTASPTTCQILACCEDDCCGPGTSYDPSQGRCVLDPGSSGWARDYSDEYEVGCAPRKCCEGSCCTEDMLYDEDINCCVNKTVVHTNMKFRRSCPGNGPVLRNQDCDGDGQGVPETCFCPGLGGDSDCTTAPPICSDVCGFLGVRNCRASGANCPPPPGTDDDRIDTMVDAAGDKVELSCVDRRCNGAGGVLYQVRYIPAGGGASRVIGACLFPWGGNSGWKEKTNGKWSEITWYNYEGRYPNGQVHDHDNSGFEERYCFIYTPANRQLRIKCQRRPINADGTRRLNVNNDGTDWVDVGDSGEHDAPTDMDGLNALLAATLDVTLVPPGTETHNDQYSSCINFDGVTSSVDNVTVEINHFPVVVDVQGGSSLADVARDVTDAFNAFWVDGEEEQTMQGFVASLHPTDPTVVRISGAIEEQIIVIIGGGDDSLGFALECPIIPIDALQFTNNSPTTLNVGDEATYKFLVFAGTTPIPDVRVDFTKAGGSSSVVFDQPDASPDDVHAKSYTKEDGVAELHVAAIGRGSVSIEATVEGTGLSVILDIDVVVTPP